MKRSGLGVGVSEVDWQTTFDFVVKRFHVATCKSSGFWVEICKWPLANFIKTPQPASNETSTVRVSRTSTGAPLS